MTDPDKRPEPQAALEGLLEGTEERTERADAALCEQAAITNAMTSNIRPLVDERGSRVSEFKVGDQVRVTGDTAEAGHEHPVGYEGSVTDIDGGEHQLDDNWWVHHKDLELVAPEASTVDHPPHYTWLGGIEVIDITEQLSFTLGNVVKYVLRADHKGKPIEDLEKAQWYLAREIARRKGER